LAKRVIAQDMKCVTDASGITVFTNEGSQD